MRRRKSAAAFLVALAAAVAGCGGGSTPRPAPDVPPSNAGRVLWSGDAASGDLSQYPTVQQCTSNRTTVVPDPLGLPRKAIKFTVLNGDVKPCTPTKNPRAQVLSPKLLSPGRDYWIGFSILVPTSFPVTRTPGDNWVSVASIYGPPFKGPGPSTLYLNSSPGINAFYYRRNAEYKFDTPWQMPLVRGKWVDFALHIKLSDNGYREQWVNTGSGWKRSLFDGKPRLDTATFTSTNDGDNNFSKLSLYYRRGIMPQATLYFADHKIGTSFTAVAPDSYSRPSSGT
jgi:hypothetical protein